MINIIQQKETILTVDEITVERTVDMPSNRICHAYIVGYPRPIVLWSDADYDAIGQWTDIDVTNRLNAFATSGITPFKL